MVSLNGVTISDESGRMFNREVQFVKGKQEDVFKQIPDFELRDFQTDADSASNPFLQTVCRLPLNSIEREMPVGVVSNRYSLATHREVFNLCLKGMKASGVDTDDLQAECGLSELGEWMNLRFYFPEKYNYTPNDKNTLRLRLECYNSVDGSARLVILLGWYRMICSNGMIIGESKAEFSDMHDQGLDTSIVPAVISKGLEAVKNDQARMRRWEQRKVDNLVLGAWANGPLASKWGKKAASRIYWICSEGRDSKITDPFAEGSATEKPVALLENVPGSPTPASNIYDVSQAMAWVSTNTKNLKRREEMQFETPKLLTRIKAVAPSPLSHW